MRIYATSKQGTDSPICSNRDTDTDRPADTAGEEGAGRTEQQEAQPLLYGKQTASRNLLCTLGAQTWRAVKTWARGSGDRAPVYA